MLFSTLHRYQIILYTIAIKNHTQLFKNSTVDAVKMKLIQSETRLMVVEAKEWEALKGENEELRAKIEALEQTVTSGTGKTSLVQRAKNNAKKFWKSIRGAVVKEETDGWETCEEPTWTVTSNAWDDSVGQSWDDTTTDLSQATTGFGWPGVENSQERQQIDQEEIHSSLKVRSRLNDISFYETPASKYTIPVKDQQLIMNKALRQSQATVYRAVRTRCPDIQRRHYYDGPPMVRFGYGELKPIFRAQECPIPGLSNVVVEHIFGVIDLRNAISHFEPSKTAQVDHLLQRAQALAVVLGDEKTAFKVCALRDELQEAAIKTYEVVKAGVGIAALPFSRPWARHIQRLFDYMTFENPADDQKELPYPVEVLQAANEWRQRYIGVGELDPEYEANVAKARKSSLTDLQSENPGCASVNNYNTAVASDSGSENEQPCPGPVLNVRFGAEDAKWTPQTALRTEKRKRAFEDDDEDSSEERFGWQ